MYDPLSTDRYFMDRATFQYRTSWIPRRCYSTQRWIWGRAVRGRQIITGPGDPVIEDRWYHPQEATIMMLKGGLNGVI